jgi:hypothetical protein
LTLDPRSTIFYAESRLTMRIILLLVASLMFCGAITYGLVYARRAGYLHASRQYFVIVDDAGKRLMTVFDGVKACELLRKVNAAHKRPAASPCAVGSKKASAWNSIRQLFTVQTALAQSCFQETICYDHYAVIEYNECFPACPDFYRTYYVDSSQSSFTAGAHRDGTSSCDPVCSYVCNYAQCSNP